MDFIELIGLRQNNLKNISLKIPHDCLTVITGLSGSGKSSLAFDTLYAEGQWRFIESLSTYARLYLNKLERPEVEAIHNLRPAIALEQKNPVKGSRSTVGTLTEVYDLLRIIYSRLGRPFCPACGKEVIRWNPEKVVTYLLENHHSERAMVVFETSLPGKELMKDGFYRFWDGKTTQDIRPETEGPIEVVVDRLRLDEPTRLAEAVELAFKKAEDKLRVYLFKDTTPEVLNFSSGLVCDHCGKELPEPDPILFSFNHPVGACPVCKGFGNILYYDEELIVPDPELSLEDGAIEVFQKPAARWWQEQLIKGAKKAKIDTKRPFKELPEQHKRMVFEGCEHFYGVNDFFDELESMTYKLHVRVFLSRYRSQRPCPECNGKRLKPEALAYRFHGYDIAELSCLSVQDLKKFFDTLKLSKFEEEVSREALEQIKKKLQFLSEVGLDYLTLDRQARTLSGGEYQRVNLANQIGSALTGTLYVLDEPTVGLHPRDTSRIVRILKNLASEGNTVVVVEHDQEVIRSADYVIELGPGGGRQGGEVVFSGKMDEFLKTDTITSSYIKGLDRQLLEDLKDDLPEPERFLVLKGARGHNLKDVTFRVPLQKLVVVTGVSGSGKSSLVVETLYRALARRFKVSTEIPLPYSDIENVSLIKGVKLIDQ
ncbi:MAG: excinuclease ABC subunit A, partial [Nitrospirae bacterium]